jgi:protein-disulfide isomerase
MALNHGANLGGMTPAPPAHIAMSLAVAGGTWIFLGVIVALFFILAYGYYTRRGSGISQTPYRRPDGPPESPGELAHDTTQELRNWERGTEGHHRRRELTAATDPAVAQALTQWRARAGKVSRLEPPTGPADRVRGPDEAPTMALFIDVSNEPCRSAYRLLSELAGAGRIRLAVRQLPLADVHPLSLPAAEVLEAAAARGTFFELLDDLAASIVADEDELLERAAAHVSDPDALRMEVSAGRHRAAVIEQIGQAAASGVPAVPAVYIDGEHYDGAIRTDDIHRALRG